jgi:phospholipid/cholesterol/gamma-HCH transport system permease protein
MVSTDYKIDKSSLKLTVKGRLDADAVGEIWPEAIRKLSESKPSVLEIDASDVEYCDGTGAALLLQLKKRQEREKRQFLLKDLKPEFEQLIKIFDPGQISEYTRKIVTYTSHRKGRRRRLSDLERFKSANQFSG